MRSIFEYADYREYLKDYYKFMKGKKRSFSFRLFARLANSGSPSTLKRVIAGERNLTDDSIQKFGKALKLNKEELEFFSNLVHFNQAKSVTEKQEFAKKLTKFRQYRALHPLTSLQMEYYRNWYYILIREMVQLSSFKGDPNWIAQQITPPISVSEAARALEELLKLGLIERDNQGKFYLNTKNVSTGDEVSSVFVSQFHKEMITKAIESLTLHSREERDISSLTIAASTETANKIKEKLQLFRKEILELAAHDHTPDRIYQVNFQLFPLSKKITDQN